MSKEKRLVGGLVLVCVLIGLVGGVLWLRMPAKRLIGPKLADLLDPVEEQRLSLIAQQGSARKAEV